MSGTNPDGGSAVSSVSFSDDASKSTAALSDLSERDRVWDSHRASSDRVASHYRGTEFERYAERIHYCSEFLDFRLVPDRDSSYRLKLAAARFCHARQCIICCWRKSLATRARAYKALPQVIADYPTARYLFLTLTVKNCAVTELRDTLKWMNQSFSRMTKLKDWQALGYLRTTEVTRGRDGKSAHPHFHCLLMVKASYFGRNYISQAEWVSIWKKALRVDYNPILDVQALKTESSLVGLLCEVIKYQCKPNDIVLSDREWFLELTRQLHRTKAVAFGGILKEYFRELDKEVSDEEMIGLTNESDEIDEGHLYFGWKRKEKRYRTID